MILYPTTLVIWRSFCRKFVAEKREKIITEEFEWYNIISRPLGQSNGAWQFRFLMRRWRKIQSTVLVSS